MGHRLFGLILVAAGLCAAQPVLGTADALKNRDILALAKAGFRQDFLIDAILSSRTEFDTSVSALTELANQGLSERIIRVMMNPPAYATTTASPSVAAPAAPEPVKRRGEKAAPVAMAIRGGTPYEQKTSFLWGLVTRQQHVGTVLKPEDGVSPHLGSLYDRVRVPRPAIPIGGNSAVYANAATASPVAVR